jgi:hypothetical protein
MSMTRQVRAAVCIFGGAALLLFASQPFARAGLMAYEGFNYTNGMSLVDSSTPGGDGSFGWAARWYVISSGFATNQPGSLFYTDTIGSVLLTNGGHVVVGVPGGTTVNSSLSRSLNIGTLNGNIHTGLTNSPGTYWASFIMRWVGPATTGSTTNQYGRKGTLFFRSGALTNSTSTGTALFSAGSPNVGNRLGTPYDTWTTWTGSDATVPAQNTGLAASSTPLNATTFVLMRFDLDGGPGLDTVYTWFNWTNLNIEPPISLASTTNSTANEDGLNNIRIDANGGNATAGTNTVLAVDEFRLGNTFADVTPHSTGSVQPPTITAQPANVTTTETYPANFSLSVLGTEPIRYQWYFNTNTLLTGQTNISMTINNVQFSDVGSYHCIVTNDGGAVTGSPAMLAVLAPVLPGVAAQPMDVTNAIGFNATFTVGAAGSAPLSYQWNFNTNTPLGGKTNTTLSFVITSANDAGAYSVIVTNKFGSITSSFVRLTVSAFGAAQLPAFPGADGAAKLVSGGRGGTVYHVTKLNSALDDPERNTPGTLLYGLTSVSGARTIVFDVAGVFHLGNMDTATWTSGGNAWNAASRQSVGANNITIAGQTAPGPVIIMGGTLKPAGNNMVFRNITIAAGYGMDQFWESGTNPPAAGTLPTSYTMDAMDISGQNIMIDHIDAWFGSDELISCNEQANNLTIQYCNHALGQNYQQHGYGHLLQPNTDFKLSFLHNLDAHIRARLPRVGSEVGTGSLNDFRNNVQYNWLGDGPGYSGAQQYSKNNFINNFYLAGNGGDSDWDSTEGGGVGIFSGSSGYTTVYAAGNLKDTNKDGDPNDAVAADGSANYQNSFLRSSAYDINIGVTLNAADSFTNVLRYVGSRWWERDYDAALGNVGAVNTLSERILYNVATGTGRILAWADDPYDVSGSYAADPANEGAEWRALWALRPDTNGVAPFNRSAGWDTDQDGIPNYWETEHGLNPSVANNNGDFDNDGYTDLEEYMNDIAAWPAPGVIVFTGDESNRYARIFNWRVYGAQVNITNLGNTTTFSFWQPSRYDTALISNQTVIVDAVGQHAGILRLTNNATLNLNSGWLNVATRFDNAAGCTSIVSTAGSLITSNLVNKGVLRLAGSAGLTVSGTFTNTGTLDVMTWNGTLPGGLVNTGTIIDRNVIQITSASPSGVNFQVAIQGYTGHNYQLQHRNDLASGTWLNVGSPVPGNNAPLLLIHTNGAAALQRYYRVSVD